MDENELSFVVKPNKVVFLVEKVYLPKSMVYAKHEQLRTVVHCVCGYGTFIPSLVIFKGVRWTDNLK